ncbi:cell surface protein SprA, partial [candidate division GN15 bacterium]|nr:cell surface protein SprA [candidate division GN15 bacterium]
EADLTARYAKLYVDPTQPDLFETESFTSTRRFSQLAENQYRYYNDDSEPYPYVFFNTSRRQSLTVGVYMVVDGPSGQREIGDVSGDTLVLKLIRPLADQSKPTNQTWGLEWRNVYEMPRGTSIEDMDIKILKGLAGTEGQGSNREYQEGGGGNNRYIQILGVDQYNTSNIRIPDGKVDARTDIFRADWGLLIFPEREPFNSKATYTDANGNQTPVLDSLVPQIYNYRSQSEKTENSLYYIQTVTRTRSSTIRLNRANIIEGSERVYLNGQLLQKDVDYSIQYDFGQVTLLTDAATDPNAEVKVDFEYAPFFVLQKKTLLGARAEYELGRNFRIGSTVLYKTDKAQERKPRVGQETAEMMVYDVDAEAQFKPGFMTGLANALPFVTTEAESRLNVSGEVAQSRPNPNVDDVAYVDDFEGALEQLSLSKSRTTWRVASRPEQLNGFEQRGRLLWHTPLARDLPRYDEVYDGRSQTGDNTLRTMRIIYRPKNFVADTLGDTTFGTGSWAGIMRYFGNRVDAKRAQLLEVRMRTSDSMRAKMHIEFGVIREELGFDGLDGATFTEDVNRNGKVDETEDVGLDGVPDVSEPGYGADNLDPNGDNFWLNGEGKCPLPGGCDNLPDSLYFEWANGTEGNLKDLSFLGEPDEEALGNSPTTNNSYFSYVIDFSQDTGRFAADSLFVDSSAKNGWGTYRIPIRDTSFINALVQDEGLPAPDLTDVTHVRVWFESDETQFHYDTVEIADWYFVQSNWQDTLVMGPGLVHEAKVVVSAVSEEDGTYTPPPGVEPYENPQTGIIEPQRGLQIDWSDLYHYDTAMATKDLLQIERYLGYRRMEMYVYGGADIDTSKTRFFFRFGRDESNFYEYSTVVYPGWDPRNHVDIFFQDMTNLKDQVLAELDDPRQRSEIDVYDSSNAGYVLRVRGNPNVNEVLWFGMGVSNKDTVGTTSGRIWLDELRVTDVIRDVGTAARVSFNGNMADVLNYNFTYETQDPYFRGLSSATRGGSTNNLGSGETRTLISYGGTLNFDKFMPRSWGARIPISIRYSKNTRIPLLRTASDIVLPEDVRDQEKSVSESSQFSIKESFNKKGRNPLFTLLLNRISTSFSYSRSKQTSVNTPFRLTENQNVKTDVDLNVSKPPTLPLFFWTKPIPILNKLSESRLGLYPNNWRASASYGRSVNISDDADFNRVSSVSRDFSGRMDVQYRIFPSLTTTFNYDTRWDMSDLDLVNISFSNLKLGVETRYAQTFSANYDPNLLGFLTTKWTYKASYNDNWDRSTETRRSDMQRSWGVSGVFDHMKLLQDDKGKRRGGGRRRNVRGGGAKADDGGRPIYDYPLAVLRFMTGWIKEPNYSYSRSYGNSLPGMLERPALKYRFGLADQAEVPTGDSRGTSQSAGESESYSAGTSFTLLGGLRNDVRFSRSINTDLIKQGALYENVNTKWPDLSIRISRFEHLWIIQGIVNKLIDVFSPRTGYSRDTKERTDISKGFVLERSETVNYNPLLQVNFKVVRGVSLTAAYNKTVTNTEKFNNVTGEPQTETRSENSSLGLSTSYKFSAPGGIGLPLLGRLKFTSQVQIDFSVKFNNSTTETSSQGGPYVTSTDKSDVSISSNVSYSFSRMIKGGLTARWQDTQDAYAQRNNHLRELKLWAEIHF